MESIISTFHIDWKIIVAQAVNFAIVFIVLYVYALKPLSKLMGERADRISKGLDDAKKSDELLQKATKEYEENRVMLRKAAMDAEKELKQDLEKARVENLEKIKADHEEWNNNRLKQLEIDKKTLVESAKSELAALAVLAAEKIMAEKNK